MFKPKAIAKLVRQEIDAACSPGTPSIGGNRLFLRDRVNGHRYLIDTGAEISVIPPNRYDRQRQPSSVTLSAANGSSIPTYGQRCVTVAVGLRRSFIWIFTVAEVSHPILGADFLRQFNLQVDLRHHRLLDGITSLSVSALMSTAPASSIVVLSTVSDPFNLLAQFPTLTKPPDYRQPVRHNVVHRIETRGHPVHSKARRLAPDRLSLNFSICWTLGSINPPPVAGPRPCIWYRSQTETGALAATTGL